MRCDGTTPNAGASVKIYNVMILVASGTSDANGYYTFSGLSLSTSYNVRVDTGSGALNGSTWSLIANQEAVDIVFHNNDEEYPDYCPGVSTPDEDFTYYNV